MVVRECPYSSRCIRAPWGPPAWKRPSARPLTDVAIRNAKPHARPYKVGDTLGLFLLVEPSSDKL